jgi:CHASE3 domain sensor protein
MQSGTAGFVITGDERFLELYYRGADSIYDDLAQLKYLTRDNPLQQKRLDTLLKLIEEHLAFESQLIGLKRKNQSEEAERIIASGKDLALMQTIESLNRSIEEDEKLMLETRKALTQRGMSKSFQAIILFLVLAAIMLIAIYLLVQDNLAGA